MNTRLVLCLFACLIIGSHVALDAGENSIWSKPTIPYRQYGIRDGLLQSQVMGVLQDSWGYLWLSTHLGISRFDGHTFRNYYYNDELKGISGVSQGILQSGENVYVLSLGGLACFNPDGTIDKVPYPEGYKGYTHANAISGDYIFLTNVYHESDPSVKFLMRYNIHSKKFETIGESRPANWQILSILPAKDGSFNGIMYKEAIDDNQKHYYYFRLTSEQWTLGEEIKMENALELYSSNAFGDDKNLYIVSSKKNGQSWIYTISSEKDTIQLNHIASLPGRVRGICQVDNHTYVAGSDSPTGIYMIRNKQVEVLNIPDVLVNMIIRDRDGNIWLATEKGLFNLYTLNFTSWVPGMNTSPAVWDFVIDRDQQKWFNTYGSGLWRTTADGRLLLVSVLHNGKPADTAFGYFNGTEDAKRRMYFNNSNGIIVYDPSKKGNSDEFRFLPVGTCMCSWYDAVTGDVFAGAAKDDLRYLVRIRPDLTFEIYPWEKWYILSICRDGNGKLCLATFSQMGYFDEKQQITVPDTTANGRKGAMDLALDKWGRMWKASPSGLIVEDSSDKDTILIHGICPWVLNYNDQYMLAGTNNDVLAIIDLDKYTAGDTCCLRTFNRYQGVDLVEFAQAGAYQDKEGYVWMWGLDNFLRFRPEELMNQPAYTQNPISVGPVYKRCKDTDWQLIAASEHSLLETAENFLRYELLGASLIRPDELHFRYRLKSYSDQWMITNNRTIEFQNLPHGVYTLEVQSSVDGTDWSESSFSSQFEIKSPFWLSPWGIILFIFLVVGALLSMLFISRLLIIRNQEKKRQIDFLRFRAVQSRHIPHFTGNVLNNISYLVNKDVDIARQYIADFSEFSHLTLLSSTTLYRSLKEEIKYAYIYLKLEKLRFEDKLEYSIDVSPEVDTNMPIPLMVLQTFCENALKHGLRHKEGIGRIQIEIFRKGDQLILAVEDNGIGRQAAKEKNTSGTGEGLQIIQQQLLLWSKKATMHVYDLYNDDKTPAGTRFELHLPWKY